MPPTGRFLGGFSGFLGRFWFFFGVFLGETCFFPSNGRFFFGFRAPSTETKKVL